MVQDEFVLARFLHPTESYNSTRVRINTRTTFRGRFTEKCYLGHLRMGEVLVDNDAFDEHGVFQLSAHFGLDLDQFKVDVASLHIGHGEDGVDSNLGHVPVTLVDNLGAQSRHSRLDQRF